MSVFSTSLGKASGRLATPGSKVGSGDEEHGVPPGSSGSCKRAHAEAKVEIRFRCADAILEDHACRQDRGGTGRRMRESGILDRVPHARQLDRDRTTGWKRFS